MPGKKTLVFATNNSHKLSELRQIVGDKFEILSLSDINCHEEIPETHDSFQGNALEKALWIKEHYGYDCFADDSGLEVKALGGAPGVRSARYAGDGHDSAANLQLLLDNLREATDRSACFRCVIAFVRGNEEPLFFEGCVEGSILEEPVGDGGFGYDPVFVPTGWKESFAEASPERKNCISHRGKAVKAFIEYLNNC